MDGIATIIDKPTYFKSYEWVVLPRIGEMINLGGGYSKVVNVYHDLSRHTGNVLMVSAAVFEVEYEQIAEDPSWKICS